MCAPPHLRRWGHVITVIFPDAVHCVCVLTWAQLRSSSWVMHQEHCGTSVWDWDPVSTWLNLCRITGWRVNHKVFNKSDVIHALNDIKSNEIDESQSSVTFNVLHSLSETCSSPHWCWCRCHSTVRHSVDVEAPPSGRDCDSQQEAPYCMLPLTWSQPLFHFSRCSCYVLT